MYENNEVYCMDNIVKRVETDEFIEILTLQKWGIVTLV